MYGNVSWYANYRRTSESGVLKGEGGLNFLTLKQSVELEFVDKWR